MLITYNAPANSTEHDRKNQYKYGNSSVLDDDVDFTERCLTAQESGSCGCNRLTGILIDLSGAD
jgi:hypothetical protein